MCTAGVVPETLSFIEFYGPERFPRSCPPQLAALSCADACAAHQRSG